MIVCKAMSRDQLLANNSRAYPMRSYSPFFNRDKMRHCHVAQGLSNNGSTETCALLFFISISISSMENTPRLNIRSPISWSTICLSDGLSKMSYLLNGSFFLGRRRSISSNRYPEISSRASLSSPYVTVLAYYHVLPIATGGLAGWAVWLDRQVGWAIWIGDLSRGLSRAIHATK